uniref:NAD-dependent epimerase/dehydratase domain-containing protein n=1 Tax=Manihot esculenta TaxID=3983 RepID=A0A199UAW7_MANES
MNREGKVVCVTGGSGYVASWLVKFLLHHGYTVKATKLLCMMLFLLSRCEDEKPFALKYEVSREKTKSLGINFIPLEVSVVDTIECLKDKGFLADLLQEGSFDAAVDGCEAVFHTASPVSLQANADPQAELVDPAVKGTLNVLRSCAKVPSIKRVVITSSFASLPYNGKTLAPDVVVDETWFSDPAVCAERKLWYQLGKTLAEQAAWEFAKNNKMDFVTIHPGFVLGPLLQPTINSSIEILFNLINGGAQEYPDAYYRSIDVRDVAYAHIQALEIPSASGRYCLIESDIHFSKVLKIVQQHYPTLHLPKKYAKYGVSKEKAKTLGIDFIPLEVSLKDTIESLKEKGFLSI